MQTPAHTMIKFSCSKSRQVTQKWPRCLAVFATLALLLQQAQAGIHDGGRSPNVEELVQAKGLHFQGVTAAFSPDGKWIATTVCDPARKLPVDAGEINRSSKNAARNSLGCDIWLYSTKSDEKRNLTQGGGSNWSASWSPDGELLAFYSDRDGPPGLWLWDRNSNAVRKVSEEVTRQQFGFETPLWLPDGHRLLIKLAPKDYSNSQAAGSDIGDQGSPGLDKVTVTVLESPTPAISPAEGSKELASNDLLSDIALVDVRTGRLQRVATDIDSVLQKLSPDGRYLAYFEQRNDKGNVYSPYALVLLELTTGMRRELASNLQPGFPGDLSWAPDSSQVAYISTGREEERALSESHSTSLGFSGGDLYIAPIDKGTPKRVMGIPESSFLTSSQPPLWSDDGSNLYLVGTDGDVWKVDVPNCHATQLAADSQRRHLRLIGGVTGDTIPKTSEGHFAYTITQRMDSHQYGVAQINLNTGSSTQSLEEDRYYGSDFESSAISPDGRHLVVQSESSKEPPDLWLSDLGSKKSRRLSNLNPQFNDIKFGNSRLIEFDSNDGESLQAAALLPSNYRPGRRYPTVLWVYASDAEAAKNLNHFGLFDQRSFNMQLLATRGYVVLWPNIPTRVGSPIDDLMKSVMPAIDKAVEIGFTDPNRLAVMGNSNGGYSTLALITRTRRFKAAVMNAGFGDLTAFHGTMGGVFIPWVEKMGGSMGVPPWEAPSRYVENSPIFKLDRIETPLMIQAGSEDKSIIQHSDQIWVEMQRLQKPTTYLRYAGEDHVLRGAANLRDYWARVLDFFGDKLGEPLSPMAASTRP